MKILKRLVVIFVASAFYLSGLAVVSGSLNFTTLQASFNLADSVFLDALIAAVVLFVLSPFIQLMLNTLSKRAVWMSMVISLATFVVAVGLTINAITFLDQRLLVVTSALSASAIFLILTTSILALVNQFEYRQQKDDVKDLYKVSIPNPTNLLQKSIERKNFSLLSVSLSLSYVAYCVFYGRYAEISVGEIFTPGAFSVFYVAALTLFVVGSIQSRGRVLR
jgi:cation transport ATPase